MNAFGVVRWSRQYALVLRPDFGEVERERRIPARQAVGVGDARVDRGEPPVGGQSDHRHEAGDGERRRAGAQSGGRVPEVELEGGAVADLRVQLARGPVVQDDRVRRNIRDGRAQIRSPRSRCALRGASTDGRSNVGSVRRLIPLTREYGTSRSPTRIAFARYVNTGTGVLTQLSRGLAHRLLRAPRRSRRWRSRRSRRCLRRPRSR